MSAEVKINKIQYTDFENICRFCLKNETIVHIFTGHGSDALQNFDYNISEMITMNTGLEVKSNDNLPTYICNECTNRLIQSQTFRQQCVATTELLEKIKLAHRSIKAEIEITSDCDEDVDDGDVSMDYMMYEPKIETHEVHSDNAPDNNYTDDAAASSESEYNKPKRKKKRKRSQSTKIDYNNDDNGDNIEDHDKIFKPKKLKIKKEKIKKEKVFKEKIKKEKKERKPKEAKEKKLPEKSICQICGAVVLNLNNHIVSSHTEKVYNIECDICGKKFYSYGRMKEHIRFVHIDDRRYKCSLCPMAFNAKYILVKHLQRHTGIKNFQCDICGRSFGTASTLKKHKLSHTQERKFACDHCDKRFARRDGLRNHIVIHTGDRPFKCGLCPMAFKFSSTASQHRKGHINRQPYWCTVCQLGYNSIMLYKTHMKIHKEDSNVAGFEEMIQAQIVAAQPAPVVEEDHSFDTRSMDAHSEHNSTPLDLHQHLLHQQQQQQQQQLLQQHQQQQQQHHSLTIPMTHIIHSPPPHVPLPSQIQSSTQMPPPVSYSMIKRDDDAPEMNNERIQILS